MSGIEVPLEARIKYLTRRGEEFQIIKQSLSGMPNWELVNKVGHQMKGNASTFGFSELAFYGKRLENLAAAKNTQEMREVMVALEAQLQELLKKLEA